jgi:chromosome segregation ATPase
MFSNLFGESNNANNPPSAVNGSPVLNGFTAILEKIDGMNQEIKKNIGEKSQFNIILINRLQKINEQINALAVKIQELNNKLLQLQQQSVKNTQSIDEKDTEIELLNQRIKTATSYKQKTESESKDLRATIDKLEIEKKDYMNQLGVLQKENTLCKSELETMKRRIGPLEKEKSDLANGIAGLKTEIASLQSEIAALKTNLANTSNDKAQQSASITKLTDEHQQLLNAKLQELNNKQKDLDDTKTSLAAIQQQLAAKEVELNNNKAKIQELMNNAENYKNKITELENNLANKVSEGDANVQNLTSQLATLTQERESLNQQNNMLMDRIDKASLIMHDAYDNLNSLYKAIPDGKDTEPLFNAIEDTIQKISRMLSTDSTSSLPEMQPQPQPQPQNIQNASPDDIQVITDAGTTILMSKSKIKEILKSQMVSSDNNDGNTRSKARLFYSFVNIEGNGKDRVRDYIKEKEIKYNQASNRFIFSSTRGGKFRRTRRTKKLRKQKGGFTYTKKSKRTKIITKTITASRKRSYNKSSRKRSK